MRCVPTSLLLGTEESVPATLSLNAGPLRVQLRGTRLLSMDVRGHEVWHGAAFLYRDEGWGTPEPVTDQTWVEQREDAFQVRVQGHIPARQRIDLWIEISGQADGSLVYEVRAVPRASLASNRTGLCVLHPPSTFGRRIEVTHVDGRTSVSSLPLRVAPWPPFMQVRALRHEYADGAWATCQLEGDSFELEDQRNNADASFKTYSRSNLMPRPFTLVGGQEIRQRLSLRVEHPLPAPCRQPALDLSLAGPLLPMPALGTAISVEEAGAAMNAQVARALRELAPARLHLGLRSPHEAVQWRGVSDLLAEGGSRLRLDVEGLDEERAPQDLGALAAAMAREGVVPAEVAVFPGTPAILSAARQAFTAAAIGSGTPYFFAQINRIEGLGKVDFLSFTTASIVHGADDDDVMHGLQSLPWLLETLAADYPHVPVHTGPSAIAAPRSPLGPQPEGDGVHRIALARRDPRTGAMFGAAWVLGHVASLAQAGARAVSVLELLGEQGLLSSPQESLRRRPAFFVLQALAGATHLRRVDTGASATLAALYVAGRAGCHLLLANLTGQTVQVPGPAWVAGVPSVLDPQAVESGDASPWRAHPSLPDGRLGLPAWSILRMECDRAA
jgi:hypothetical protein